MCQLLPYFYLLNICVHRNFVSMKQFLRKIFNTFFIEIRQHLGHRAGPGSYRTISVSVKEIFQRVADAWCLRLGSQSEKLSDSSTPYLFIFGVALSNIKYQSFCCRNGVTLMVEITEYGCY